MWCYSSQGWAAPGTSTCQQSHNTGTADIVVVAACACCVVAVLIAACSLAYLQDWGPAFVPAGVTGGVELVGFDRATLIGELQGGKGRLSSLVCLKMR
jgi:hypothetical protein